MTLVELIRSELPEFGTDEPLPEDFIERYARAFDERIAPAIEQRTESPSGEELFDYGRADYLTFWNSGIAHTDRYTLVRPPFLKLFYRDVELQLSSDPELIKLFKLVRPEIKINPESRKYEMMYGYPRSGDFSEMHAEINGLLARNGFDREKMPSLFMKLEEKLHDVQKQWRSKFKNRSEAVKGDFNMAYAHNKDSKKIFGYLDPVGQLDGVFTDSFNILFPLFTDVSMNANPQEYL